MLRQGLIFLIASALVVLFARYVHVLIVYIDIAYTYVNMKMAGLFSHNLMGVMLRKVLTLMIFPLALAGIPALLYHAIRHRTMPHYIELAWFIWIVVVLSCVLIR